MIYYHSSVLIVCTDCAELLVLTVNRSTKRRLKNFDLNECLFRPRL